LSQASLTKGITGSCNRAAAAAVQGALIEASELHVGVEQRLLLAGGTYPRNLIPRRVLFVGLDVAFARI
jgi:hypothetical protein